MSNNKNINKPIKIIKIEPSENKDKRFKITLNNSKTYNFGLESGNTYIDHWDKEIRANYRARHYAAEKEFINNLTPSPALFSYYILWGNSRSIDKNIRSLNKMFRLHNIH
jgi:hypothetical protein